MKKRIFWLALIFYGASGIVFSEEITCPIPQTISGKISDCEKPDCYVTGPKPWNKLSDKHNIIYQTDRGGPDTQEELNDSISGMSFMLAEPIPDGYYSYLLRCSYENHTSEEMQRFGGVSHMSFQIEQNAKECHLISENTFECSSK